MVGPYTPASLAVVAIHLVLAVLALDMTAMLALMTLVMGNSAVLLLLGLLLDLGIAASLHDLAALGVVLAVVSLATMLVVIARVVRGTSMFVSPASHDHKLLWVDHTLLELRHSVHRNRVQRRPRDVVEQRNGLEDTETLDAIGHRLTSEARGRAITVR